MKILYVEDDLKIAEALKMFLGMFHDVHHVPNGLLGLNAFKESDEFDLIITDISMPHMNGLEMIENIRKIDEDIPVFVISAFDDSDFIDRAFALGIKRYIEKPVRVKEIMQMIKEDVEVALKA